MSTTQIDPRETQTYFDLLCPDAPADAYLVVSWRTPRQGVPMQHKWERCADVQNLVRRIIHNAPKIEIFIGVGLRHPDCTSQQDKRGKSEDVYALPGLWIELDHNAGVHAAKHLLPTPQELLEFIQRLPFDFSLIVDSSGGYHCYALFKELWILDTPKEHQQAALLLRRFQRTIQVQAAAHGWKVDSTADLARVLRPAGTYNYKTDPPKPVTILHEDAIRYNPSDIADAEWLAT